MCRTSQKVSLSTFYILVLLVTDSFHEYRQLSLLPKWGEESITLHLHSKAALLGLNIALLVSFKDDSVGPPPSWCVAGQVQVLGR